MRGDSIRDLYAKGLALVGLGVLAGAGALVDYWPASSALPAAESLTRPEGIAPPAPLPASEVIFRPAVAIQPNARRSVAVDVAAPVPVPMIDARPVTDAIGESVSLLAPPREPMPEPVVIFASAAPMMDLVAREAFELPAEPTLSVGDPTAWASGADADSFLTGSLKRTGATIMHTGAKTGASIFDAFRTVGSLGRSLGGAVRRALPD